MQGAPLGLWISSQRAIRTGAPNKIHKAFSHLTAEQCTNWVPGTASPYAVAGVRRGHASVGCGCCSGDCPLPPLQKWGWFDMDGPLWTSVGLWAPELWLFLSRDLSGLFEKFRAGHCTLSFESAWSWTSSFGLGSCLGQGTVWIRVRGHGPQLLALQQVRGGIKSI